MGNAGGAVVLHRPPGARGGRERGFIHKMSTECHRILWILLDGVGDVSTTAASRTPLELARRPYLDAVARAGLNGLCDPCEPGLACGSDTAHMSMLGYDPRKWYRGRGAFESLGTGLDMGSGDIAFKCNFATLEEPSCPAGRREDAADAEEPVVLKRRCARDFAREGPILCAELDGMHIPGYGDRYEVRFKYATEHRCGVVVRGPGLSDKITGTDPLKDGLRLLKCAAAIPDDDDAEETARVIDALSMEIRRRLAEHPLNRERREAGEAPANVLLLRGCGKKVDAPSFAEMHDGLRGCMIAPTKIIAGIGKTFDIDILPVEGATGDYHTRLSRKAARAARALGGEAPSCSRSGMNGKEPYDFCFLHVKGIDDAGHDGNLALKIALIQKADSMVGQLVRMLWEQQAVGKSRFIICITGDHSTPVHVGDHSHEPVPFTVARLEDIVMAIGEEVVRSISLDEIPPVDAGITSIPLSPCGSGKSAHTAPTTGPCIANADCVQCFTETGASYGALGRFSGSEIMPLLLRMRSGHR